MSATKRRLEERDDRIQAGRDVLVQAGGAEYCEFHDEFLSTGDSEAEKQAYAIATNKWKDGEIEGTREEVMESVQTAINDAADECYACRKIEDE